MVILVNKAKEQGLDVEAIKRLMGIPPRTPGWLELAIMPRLAIF
jgi:hypothetical protein